MKQKLKWDVSFEAKVTNKCSIHGEPSQLVYLDK